MLFAELSIRFVLFLFNEIFILNHFELHTHIHTHTQTPTHTIVTLTMMWAVTFGNCDSPKINIFKMNHTKKKKKKSASTNESLLPIVSNVLKCFKILWFWLKTINSSTIQFLFCCCLCYPFISDRKSYLCILPCNNFLVGYKLQHIVYSVDWLKMVSRPIHLLNTLCKFYTQLEPCQQVKLHTKRSRTEPNTLFYLTKGNQYCK